MANNDHPKKVRFRDEEGRFVAEALRYKYATVVERKVRGKWHRVTEGTKVITPKRLTELITRDEFESLDPAYGKETVIVPTARKYTAWDIAEKMNRARGLKGKQLRVEMNILDGESLRKIVFYRKMKTRGNPTYGIFAQMNEVIRNSGFHLYNRIGSIFVPDRKGKQVKLQSVTIQPVI